MKRLVAAFLLVLALGVCGAVRAREAAADLKLDRVALFKNGLVYVGSSASLPRADSVTLGRLPIPVFGTFWVTYPEGVEVEFVVTELVDVSEDQEAASIIDMLSANVGHEATVHQGNGSLSGTILRVVRPPAQPRPVPYLMSSARPPNPATGGHGLLLLRTADGVTAVDPGSLTRVDIEEAGETYARTERVPSLRIQLARQAAGSPINVSYLARGMTWSPSYMIDLTDPQEASFSAKAVVVNELLDLDGVEVELVTGFPHVLFSEVQSPISMAEPLSQFLNSLRRGDGRERNDRAWMTQQRAVVSNFMGFPGDRYQGIPPAYSAEQPGQAAEDLFFYPAGKMTLNSGSTAMLPLFTVKAPYEHVYTWEIEDSLDEQERYRQDRRSDEPEEAPVVWHVCRIRNTTQMPWTTAPAQFITGGRIVGQDTCYYTPAGNKTDVRINRALNMVADQAEYELERERNAARFYGRSYDLVTVRGELKLSNRVGKNVHAEVIKHLSGEVVAFTPDAKDVPTAKGLKRVNSRHDLIWTLDLEPGEKADLSYTYKVYVRN